MTEIKHHKFVLIPREKVIMGGPMTVFIRCKNKGCSAGVDYSWGDPKECLKMWKDMTKDDPCPFRWIVQ